jgi:hypothetical protein
MTIATTIATGPSSRRRLQSTAAVIVGFISVAVLSLATDQLLHVLDVYPPWGEPMWGTGLNLLALSYRLVYTVIGGYITARLAPQSPMRHVWVLAILGCVTATAGAITAIQVANLVQLVLIALADRDPASGSVVSFGIERARTSAVARGRSIAGRCPGPWRGSASAAGLSRRWLFTRAKRKRKTARVLRALRTSLKAISTTNPADDTV